MQTGMLNKDKRSPNLHLVFVRSGETTKTIAKGAPCYFTMNGTDDGFAVKSPSSGSDLLAHMFFAGAPIESALSPNTAGDASEGNILAYGFHPALKVTRATRAATSDSWSSSASIAAGQALTIDTVNDAWITGGDTLAKRRAALGESIASMAASATATNLTDTVITVAAKGWVFAM